MPVPVWGWAAPREQVTVEFAGQKKSTTADADGHWSVKLAAMPASAEPRTLSIRAETNWLATPNILQLTNVLVGEVWLCSGQSNMEKPIGAQSGQKPTVNALHELAVSADAQIRLFKVEKTLAATPARDVKSRGWFVCDSNSLESLKFSAAGYFFGRDIHRDLEVPIGIIESSWGGTRIEPWTPPVGFKQVKGLADLANPITLPTGTNKLANTRPTVLYNAMIAPLVPFALRGALWYQGESNVIDKPDGPVYTDKMEALIRGWREVWGQGKFPFYYVQLAPYCYFSRRPQSRAPGPETLAEMWEYQTRALRVPHTGMAVITDLVDDLSDIHPVRKKEVGHRLALLALAHDYGRKDRVCSGPMFKSVKFKEGQAVISFENLGGGLVCQDAPALTWFTVAGADGKFVPADARIAGATVVVSAKDVPTPKAVRFAWHETAQPNLFNQAGLPAAPFRTDSPKAKK
jgi:sialate O-acetylesterase